MSVFKIARYRIQPNARGPVEEAMRTFAAYVAEELPDSRWTTYRERGDDAAYVSVIGADDGPADERHRKADGTKRFVDALYPKLDGDVAFTDHELVATSEAGRATAPFDGTPQHARLARLEGAWRGTARTTFDPSTPPEESPWTGRITLPLGGRFARFEYGSRVMDRPHAGELTIAYESGDRRWRTAWIDSFHTSPAILISDGEQDAPDAIVVRGTYFAAEGHPRWGWITEIDDRGVSEGRLVITMKNVTPDGQEMPALDIELGR